VFEIHSATKVGTRSIGSTWHPIEGYKYEDAETAFNAYELTHSHISVSGTKVTIRTDVVTYNYRRFLIQFTTHPNEVAGHTMARALTRKSSVPTAIYLSRSVG